jgi:hypothetical protein
MVELTEDALREAMIQDLLRVFAREGYDVHGYSGGPPPSRVKNQGFGSGRDRVPDVIGMDRARHRVVFALVRTDRKSLDTEEALEEYNVFLDHNEGLGERASILLVQMPAHLLPEFTGIITHYIHREYWHRVIPVAYEPEARGG